MDESGQGDAEANTVSGPDCPLCGEATSFGLATCLPCAGIGADGLLFARPQGNHETSSIASRLRASVARNAEPEALQLVAGGHRAIAAVPLGGEEALVEAFRRMGIPVRLVPARWARGRLPTGVVAATAVATSAGLLAGLVAAPAFLLLTPLFAGSVLALSQIRLRRPVVEPHTDLTLLGSAKTARAVGRQLGSLTSGVARTSLSRIASLARVVERRAKGLDDTESLNDLRVLVESAAPVAGELDRVHTLRSVLEGPEFEGDIEQREALTEVDRAAGMLERALSDAVTALSRSSKWEAAALEEAHELPRLAHTIETRMEAWDEALATVDRLVSGARS